MGQAWLTDKKIRELSWSDLVYLKQQIEREILMRLAAKDISPSR